MNEQSRTSRKGVAPSELQPPPLKVSRWLHAPRELVFKAWGRAEHVQRWFSPEHFTIPTARVTMQPGGEFDLCMQAPGGEQHWTRGRFIEVNPYSRLVLDLQVTDAAGVALFRAYTEVEFSDASGGTRIDVVQTYTFIDLSQAAAMVAGASAGWRSTLDKLEQEVLRMRGAGALDEGAVVRSVVHATFHLERTYEAPVARVWHALTDLQAKQQWFTGTPGRWELIERHMDVRVGGREHLQGRWEGGLVSTFDAIYHDVIPNERLVYSYVMYLDQRKISVSLATLQLRASGEGTRLMLTEQGAFLDGYEDAGSREQGTRQLLEALGASLAG